MRALFRFMHLTGLWSGFVKIGMLLSRLIPLHNESGLFFFFPYYHIGGAEKVHADIVSCFAASRPWVIFTRRSQNANYKPLFAKSARLFDLWFLGFLYPVSIGVAAGFVNRHANPVAFGCNSPFYYYLVPYLSKGVRTVDLTHAFDGLENLSLKVVAELDARIAINGKTVEDFATQYRENGVDSHLNDRVLLIENRVDIPAEFRQRLTHSHLRIVYVGRGTVEKRAHLLGRIASLCAARSIPAEFVLVGRGLADAVLGEDRTHCRFVGEICDPAELQKLYAESDILLLTSSREGFPLVIMEAMANGVVPICTNVGGIALHLNHGSNGFLVDNTGEEDIVQEITSLLLRLHSNGDELTRLSRQSYDYARSHFSSETFCNAYRAALLGSGDELGKMNPGGYEEA